MIAFLLLSWSTLREEQQKHDSGDRYVRHQECHENIQTNCVSQSRDGAHVHQRRRLMLAACIIFLLTWCNKGLSIRAFQIKECDNHKNCPYMCRAR